MPSPTEQHLAGRGYLEAVTALLQRVRNAYPTAGLKEAADLQWSWRNPRSTDKLPQLFWLDDNGLPEAAMIATGSDDEVNLDLIVMPAASPDWVAHVVDRGLAHVDLFEPKAIELEVDHGEPMRTESDHQQRGLARHVLTAGLDLLANAGANRVKLVYEPDNVAASHLYLSVGFKPDRQTDIFRRADVS